jgi:hypothetical protein
MIGSLFYFGILEANKMYIKNPETIKQKYVCGKKMAKYLMKKRLPLLSQDFKRYYFSDTDELKKIISEIPWYLKLFIG